MPFLFLASEKPAGKEFHTNCYAALYALILHLTAGLDCGDCYKLWSHLRTIMSQHRMRYGKDFAGMSASISSVFLTSYMYHF